MTSVTTRGWFITGTDTGVGKTVVSCAIARGLRERGIDLGVMKPVETGVGEGGPLDAQELRTAAGVDDALDEICPFQFALPAAPNVAAAAENRTVNLDTLAASFERLAARHDTMLVEGAGGLLVPVTDEVDMAELAQRLGLEVVVVARMALGTINHTLLTLREIERRGIAFAGVVLSEAGGTLSKADEANLEHLRRVLGDRLLGEVPASESPESVAIDGRTLDRLLQGD